MVKNEAPEESRERYATILRSIYRVIANKDKTFERKVEELLRIGRNTLGTEYGALSYIEDDDYIFEIVHDPDGETKPGDVVPLEETNCERAIDTERTLVLADIEAEAPELTTRAGVTEMGVQCYIGTPVMVHGEVYGTFCFYDRDVREEQFSEWDITLVDLMGKWISYELEREQREARLTRQRNRLDDFANVVAHDLRNPINVAQAYIEFARNEPENKEEHLEGIETALDRMVVLIDDVLALARIERQEIDSEPVNLRDVITDAWETAATDSMSLSIEETLVPVVGSHSHLQQAFENLIRNTGDHVDSAATIRIGLLDDERGFYFEDDGPGIPPEKFEQVFQTGFSTGDNGTGFGLSIVKEIVEAHGWSITVTEGKTGGARFEIDSVKFV
ncbi:GAF domain-containing sensor histidine kinase [Haladaptatus cibarius]|uniref:GAF domain-containing sensor histidine kinase n=1 Tax=Haladaptatus cibarius TaxID=453847 RepID=UPI00067895CA|nr:GAF domain-containing sensor histidine kinase [Haladaptatus cibarius]